MHKVKDWENTKITLTPDQLADAYDAERQEYHTLLNSINYLLIDIIFNNKDMKILKKTYK